MTKINYENLVSQKMQDLSNIGAEIRNTFMLGETLKKTSPNLIDLSLGNPDLEPPSIVKNKLKELSQETSEGVHRYMDGAGLVEIRQFIADELTQSEATLITENEVFLTVGAAGALQICMRTFLEPGDEVIIFAPYFPEYLSYTHHLGAVPIVIQSDDAHLPLLEDFKQNITFKTKLIIMNSPNNPSGVSYGEEFLKKFFQILENANVQLKRQIPLISDEPYMRLMYTPRPTSLLQYYSHTFLVRSLSKDLGLAGERIGYFAWRKDAFPTELNLMSVFRNAARVSGFVSAPRFMQRLIPSIFQAKVNIEIYKERVDAFLSELKKAQIDCAEPAAGFFVFPKLNCNDKEFCQKLAQNGVLCVPGSAFGKPGYLRASLTQDIVQIKKAAQILSRLLAQA